MPTGDAAKKRRILIACGIYLLATLVYFAFADASVVHGHTPWNHFALLADAWRHGRLDLGAPPPDYTGLNDFSRFEGKWYVVFPPFPALLLVPVAALAGGADRVADGLFFLFLAGIAPALLFLSLEKLRRFGRSEVSERANVALALSFAFGSVYFFSAEQGTVWFAAHVVGAALGAAYLLFALEAERPWLAGLALGLGFATRTPLLFAAPLFVLEAWRTLRPSRAHLSRSLLAFATPVVAVLCLTLWHNQRRFGDPFETGYRYLGITWQHRIEKWGLFSYHYLAKNLGVMLTSLPFSTPTGPTRFQINLHGLALWLTTPLYLWLIWPRRSAVPQRALGLTALCVALPTLLYQNTGWLQFGYRFSNDYAVFLFALLALGGYRFGRSFQAAAVVAVIINAFGAATFGRPEYAAYYFQDNTQRIVYQPD
ncbi:MAG: glycosyltransferase family 87 protein [Myxococcales bacterium]|jgi:hypothetical protein